MDFQFSLIYNILLAFSLSKYSGYIDPASLTVIVAMIVGAFVGAGMTLRLYWLKLKQKLSSRK
jgi:glycerol uptake facilitator-like aquaporin